MKALFFLILKGERDMSTQPNHQHHLLAQWVSQYRAATKEGQCANYIPALAKRS